MKFKTAYGTRKPVQTFIKGKSMTHQSEAPACDINYIMKKYERTRTLDHVNTFGGSYADFTNTPMDYQESMNAVIAADEMFQSLPSKVRKRFHNDAASFIEFVGNPDNREEIARLGLSKAPQASNSPDPVIDPPEPKKAASKAPSSGSDPEE